VKLTKGAQVWAWHTVEVTHGRKPAAAEVVARGALVPEDVRPDLADEAAWEPAQVLDRTFGGGLEVAVWCDVTDVEPGTRLAVWVHLTAGTDPATAEQLPVRTGYVDVV